MEHNDIFVFLDKLASLFDPMIVSRYSDKELVLWPSNRLRLTTVGWRHCTTGCKGCWNKAYEIFVFNQASVALGVVFSRGVFPHPQRECESDL